MTYRIEMEMINKKYNWTDKHEFAKGIAEVKTFLKNCVEDGYKVTRIVKLTKDGRGIDVTQKYIR